MPNKASFVGANDFSLILTNTTDVETFGVLAVGFFDFFLLSWTIS